MDELKKLFAELHNLPAPRGFNAASDDIDVAVYQYADDITGLVSSYLAGQKVNPSDIHLNEDLDRRLEECLAKIHELRSYKQKHDTLSRLLINSLSKDSPK